MNKNLIYGIESDMLRCDKANKIYEMFELIGIHEKFVGEYLGRQEDFADYYLQLQGKTKHHFCNKGIQCIHKKLNLPIYLSKRNMRRFGKTYKGFPVVLTSYAYEITIKLLETIHNNEQLNGAYEQYIMRDERELEGFIDFQYTLLIVYLQKSKSNAKRQRYEKLFDNLVELVWNRE